MRIAHLCAIFESGLDEMGKINSKITRNEFIRVLRSLIYIDRMY